MTNPDKPNIDPTNPLIIEDEKNKRNEKDKDKGPQPLELPIPEHDPEKQREWEEEQERNKGKKPGQPGPEMPDPNKTVIPLIPEEDKPRKDDYTW